MKKVLPVIAFVALCAFAGAETAAVTFYVEPEILIPMGPEDEDGDVLYGMGGGGSLGVGLSPAGMRWLTGSVEAGFDYLTTDYTSESLSLVRVGGGVGFGPMGSMFGLRLGGHGGYYYGFYGGTGAGNLYYDGSLAVLVKLSEAFTLSLSGGWRDYLSTGSSSDPHLLRTVFAGVGVSLEPGALRARSKIIIDELRIMPLYPILMKFYATNPLGQITFTNAETSDIKDVVVSFFVPAYMDRPTVVATYPTIKKGEKTTVDLAAVFNPKILSVTEGTIAQAEITIEYKLTERTSKAAKTGDVSIYDRGAMNWDDDRKAAAFITTKDQSMLTFAKNTHAAVESMKGLAGDRNMRAALGIFEALNLFGLQYSPDPSSPYGAALGGGAVDFLQFPAQTLQFRSGDCDDLTILYCTLLESLGIETAMLTVPGHIFPAFALAMSPAEAEGLFAGTQDYIEMDGKVWIPVEITLIKKGFSQAWRQAINEYNAARGKGEANFFRVRESWEVYEPVGFIETSQAPTIPEKSKLEQGVSREQRKVVDILLAGREAELRKAVDAAKAGLAKSKAQNKLGVFYARLGLDDKARGEFEKAKSGGLVPAEVNLGNLLFRQERFAESITAFRDILAKEPDNKGALYGLVQAAAMGGQQKLAEDTLSKLTKLDGALAERVSGVVKSSAGRESYAGRESGSWQEE